MSSENSEGKQSRVTRRVFIKWTSALAAVGAATVGAAAGFGSDLLLRPNTTLTTTETQTIVQTSPPSTVIDPTAETITYKGHRSGVLRAHVINGRWVRSSVVKPNLPISYRLLSTRNRTYAPDRVRYPMMRVGWAPGGKSDTSNRGKGEFVRITWDQAENYIANEMKRIYSTYGPSAAFKGNTPHQWPSAVQSGSDWMAALLAAMGGYTDYSGGETFTGWGDSSYLIWGAGMYYANTFTDILQNSKLVIYWGVDHGVRGFVSTSTVSVLQRLNAAGIRLVVVDPWVNETAGHYESKHISVNVGTDEALLAAIAYVWIQEGTYNQAWLDTHTIGFDENHLPKDAPANSSFKSYILGLGDDKTPKTPEWGSAITSVRKETIEALAHDWAANPTYVNSYTGGAQRRANAGEFVRMLITVCAMQGLGMSGRGLGYVLFADAIGGTSNPIVSVSGGTPSLPNPVTQVIHHVQFPDAILNPPISWTSGHSVVTGKPIKLTYPAQGASPIKMFAGVGGSNMQQRAGGGNRWVKALQSPNLEFIWMTSAFWEPTALYADIVLPVNYIAERDDIVAWHNYLIYSKAAIAPLYESKSDMEVVYDLAQLLGISDMVTQGKTLNDWMANAFSKVVPEPSTALNAQPATLADFQKVGYLEYPNPDLPPNPGGLAFFNQDPVNSKLATPSGLIEIYSTQIADFWGTSDPTAPVIPKYLPNPEGRGSARAKTYPLELLSGHQPHGEHSQNQQLTWNRDDPVNMVNGYQILRMNPKDAAARGIKDGDIVRAFNDRGQTLFGVYLTEKMQPGLVQTWEGGLYKPVQPGTPGVLDMGGNAQQVIADYQPEPICDGMITQGLVQVEKWGGA